MKKIFTLLAALMVFGAVNAQTDLIISEYVEAWGNNKVLEIYNPTSSAINLKDYVVKRYSNGSQSADINYTVELPDRVLEPYKTFVIAQDKRESAGTVPAEDSPIWAQVESRADYFVPSDYGSGAGTKTIHWNGNDAVTIEKNDGSIVDMFGKIGEDPAPAYIPGASEKINSWTDTPPYMIGTGTGLSADHTLVRKSSIKNGVTSKPSMFNILAEYDSLSVNTFHYLGWHTMDGTPSNTAPVINVNEVYHVSPSVKDGDKVLTVGYTDNDRAQTMKFFLGNGNFIYVDEDTDTLRHTPFAINRYTGELEVIDAEAIAKSTGDTVYCQVYVCDEYAQSEGVYFDIVITDDELSVKDLEQVKTRLTPNPAERYFYVTSNKVISEVQVISLTGQELYQQTAKSSKVRVDLDLATGSYLVRSTYADHSVSVEKLIIK